MLKSSFWPEKVRVVSSKQIGPEQFRIEAVGQETNTFYKPILSFYDLEQIEIIQDKEFQFTAKAENLFLFLEAHRIRNAFQFDPLYALNVSQINPLPHQIEAVYHYILQNPKIRFLIADDPGAGKTIMAGLLLKELKYRGLVERTLIVVPGHLKDQWLREMKEKFLENFSIVDRSMINAHWGQNVFEDRNQLIVSLDFAKQDDVIYALKDSRWDLVLVDEAHKMSAYSYGEKVSKTQRYYLGEILSSISNFLLFMTATPHRGDPENFRLFLDLLEPGFFANADMLSESIQNQDNPLFIRRLKEDMRDFDNAPLFPPRHVETIKYTLGEDEKRLYNKVTEYVQNYFNQALEKEKRNVTFALTVLQRRLASSVYAIRTSLERRYKRLNDLYQKGQLIQEAGYYNEEFIDDLEEKERWKKEEELLEKLTSAETLEDLKEEIDQLADLVQHAREVEKLESETKLVQLKKLIENNEIKQTDTKLLIFTEAKDTLEYLSKKLQEWGYSVSIIHGGMNLDARINSEAEFKHNTQIMISTEAGGEGINLQFCWIMVNYDIPWNPNRLEQRMGRVHRYGQQHEVHIYNLVAIDTKEGRILHSMFEKLDNIRAQMGSDRVFDVVGEILANKSLKELIVEAISDRRTMDDILEEFEKVPNQEALENVRKASMEALATRHIDMQKILGEQQRAKENRLVPEYVEEFCQRAARNLEFKMDKRSDGLWRIHLPFNIRNRSYAFKTKFGNLQREYNRISFDKDEAFKNQAEFVVMGHPALESIVESILENYLEQGLEGAVFSDPEGKKDGVIWFLQAEMRDGKNEVAGKRLFSVFQDQNNQFSLINPAILWDLKPEPENTASEFDDTYSLAKDDVISFVIGEVISDYREELLQRRQRDAEIKKKYGLRSLESMIMDSETKLSDYETRRMKGVALPEAIIQREQQKKEDLERKKGRLEKDVQAEVHISPTEPDILGAVRVIPASVQDEMFSNQEIEMIGMDLAMEYESRNGRRPEDVSSQDLGFDIRSKDEEKYRYIEVKAKTSEGAVALTPNEWLMAQRLAKEYWLYIISNASTQPTLYIMNNPAAKLKPSKEVEIVRYMVKDWKNKAQLAS